MKSFRLPILTIALLVSLTSCQPTVTPETPAAPATYTVTYDANGSTSGTVPTNSKTYEASAVVTVLGNTGTLAKTGSTWTGWNTKADGSGTTYTASSTFAMGSANVTLYAIWTADTITTATVYRSVANGYGYTRIDDTSKTIAISTLGTEQTTAPASGMYQIGTKTTTTPFGGSASANTVWNSTVYVAGSAVDFGSYTISQSFMVTVGSAKYINSAFVGTYTFTNSGYSYGFRDNGGVIQFGTDTPSSYWTNINNTFVYNFTSQELSATVGGTPYVFPKS